MDSFLPVLMSPAIQRLDDMYLILLRPMEELIVHSLWGSDAQMLYHEFMFIQMGNRVTETMLYNQYPRMCKKYFGVELNISDYRLWAIAVMREYIPPELQPHGNSNTVGDTLCQHSTTIARGMYSPLEGDLPYITTDAMWYYDQFCQRWQNVSGFGEGPPLTL